MKKHVHGGDVYRYENCVDFSANCNPLGTPQGVKQAIIDSLDTIADYPQVGSIRLCKAIAEYEGVSAEQVICGNGAAELVFSLCRARKPKRALLPAPTFAEYEQALTGVGCEVEYYVLKEEEDFNIGESILERLQEDPDIVFLCNPNNPTGMLTERDFLVKILKTCRERDIFLVVDECFLDFVKEPDLYTLKTWISNYPNLFLLKAFTKRYAMPGVRLGYGISGNRALLDAMEGMTQPWNVSGLAQAAGIAALKETAYVEAGRKVVFEEKEYLIREMTSLGLHVFPSEANYLFFRGPEDLFERCVKEGVLIRDCSNYPGLKKGYYRIAVKLHEKNVKLISALTRIVKRGNV